MIIIFSITFYNYWLFSMSVISTFSNIIFISHCFEPSTIFKLFPFIIKWIFAICIYLTFGTVFALYFVLVKNHVNRCPSRSGFKDFFLTRTQSSKLDNLFCAYSISVCGSWFVLVFFFSTWFSIQMHPSYTWLCSFFCLHCAFFIL